MNKVFGPETRYISTIGLAQIAANQFYMFTAHATGLMPVRLGR